MAHNDALNPSMCLLLVDQFKGDLPAYLQVFLGALGGFRGLVRTSGGKKMIINGAKVHVFGQNHPLIQDHGVCLVSIVSSWWSNTMLSVSGSK